MFDLKKVISDWRRQMLAAGITDPCVLDELECHLCEEIKLQMESGMGVRRAFDSAVRQIGLPGVIKREFEKMERTIMKRIAIIVLGSFGILFGPGIILPALAKHRVLGVWNGDIITPVVLGTIITLIGLSMAVFGFKRRKA